MLKLAKKIKQTLSNTFWQNFYFLKIIRFLHPRYYSKIIGHILKNAPKKCVLIMINYNENENEKDHMDTT